MPALSAAQLKSLAKNYQQTGRELLQYKLDHFDELTVDEFKTIGSKIDTAFHNSSLMAALATYQTGADISGALQQLHAAAGKLNTALKNIAAVQKVIDIATLVVNLGTAVLTKDVGAILSTAKDLADAVQPAVPEEDS